MNSLAKKIYGKGGNWQSVAALDTFLEVVACRFEDKLRKEELEELLDSIEELEWERTEAYNELWKESEVRDEPKKVKVSQDAGISLAKQIDSSSVERKEREAERSEVKEKDEPSEGKEMKQLKGDVERLT